MSTSRTAILSCVKLMTRRYDHIDLRVHNLAEARPFYETLLPALGFTRHVTIEGWLQFEAVQPFGPADFLESPKRRCTKRMAVALHSGLRARQKSIGWLTSSTAPTLVTSKDRAMTKVPATMPCSLRIRAGTDWKFVIATGEQPEAAVNRARVWPRGCVLHFHRNDRRYYFIHQSYCDSTFLGTLSV